eukprot:COSAG02_NODE_5007_length_4726_cov_8.568619_3_plen_565_part_00
MSTPMSSPRQADVDAAARKDFQAAFQGMEIVGVQKGAAVAEDASDVQRTRAMFEAKGGAQDAAVQQAAPRHAMERAQKKVKDEEDEAAEIAGTAGPQSRAKRAEKASDVQRTRAMFEAKGGAQDAAVQQAAPRHAMKRAQKKVKDEEDEAAEIAGTAGPQSRAKRAEKKALGAIPAGRAPMPGGKACSPESFQYLTLSVLKSRVAELEAASAEEQDAARRVLGSAERVVNSFDEADDPKMAAIEHLCRATNAINSPGRWDIMISYVQKNPHAALLAVEIYFAMRARGRTVWLDIKMGKCNTAAMEEAAKNSNCIIAIVTGKYHHPDTGQLEAGYFERQWCLKELRWAREAAVPIQPVTRREDKDRIREFIQMAPSDLSDLADVDFKSMDRISTSTWNTNLDELERSMQSLIELPRSRRISEGLEVRLHKMTKFLVDEPPAGVGINGDDGPRYAAVFLENGYDTPGKLAANLELFDLSRSKAATLQVKLSEIDQLDMKRGHMEALCAYFQERQLPDSYVEKREASLEEANQERRSSITHLGGVDAFKGKAETLKSAMTTKPGPRD